MRLSSIASGSSGNAIYVGSEDTHILIDAGISAKRIESGLKELGLKGEDLDAVLLTHEHSDHVKGLKVLSARYGFPVYATKGTLSAVKKNGYIGEYPDDLLNTVSADREFQIGDLTLKPFSIDHDAEEPVAYRISGGGKSAAVATDMGHFTDYTVRNLSCLDALLVESNHDVRMLETGPYPYYLKRRILSDFGHLSNENAGRLIVRILHDNLKYIVLGHLSKENNFPDLAYETVRCEIGSEECPYGPDDFPIEVALRESMSEILEF
jgi:phosphoribosyl 1,2-cyclic phosphodiesterase